MQRKKITILLYYQESKINIIIYNNQMKWYWWSQFFYKNGLYLFCSLILVMDYRVHDIGFSI